MLTIIDIKYNTFLRIPNGVTVITFRIRGKKRGGGRGRGGRARTPPDEHSQPKLDQRTHINNLKYTIILSRN